MVKQLLQFCLFALLLLSCTINSSIKYPEQPNCSLIPGVQEIKPADGYFVLNTQTVISGSPDLVKLFNDFCDSTLELADQKNQINFVIDTDQYFGIEGYQLSISKKEIILKAQSDSGLTRGLATLIQLALLNYNDQSYFIPCGEINDYAHFRHRGLLLDCSRHFFPVATIKKYIDLLAFYKMNTLHWHLCDDQGWRIEIEKYPNLTKTGAYRTEEDGAVYGGFYTKKQIRELVSYAALRKINIIPEIELPGHSQAVIASYPELSCTGNQIPVANDWGVFKDIYCAGNDSVFVFIENVLDEVLELFPSKYIHIGGDEAPKTRWEHCQKCQARIKAEKLKDEHELQSYFIQGIQKYLSNKGRILIGWDEILEGGLSEGAVVQSWRGIKGGIKATKQGNMAIMSPTSHAYFDYDLKSIDLEKVYSFDPVPAALSLAEQKLILGGECNMWTEHVPNEKILDSKVFPRLLAMSEVLWHYPAQRNYAGFNKIVQDQYPLLDHFKVQYGQEAVALKYKLHPMDNYVVLELQPTSENITLRYRIHCISCDSNYIEYHEAIQLEQSASIEIQPFKNEKEYGEPTFLNFDIHKGLNKEIKYSHSYSSYYSGGGHQALLDSKLGSLDFRDGNWQGFQLNDLQCVMDMDKMITGISRISANFYQYINAWIFLPTEIWVETSVDQKKWTLTGKAKSVSPENKRGKFIETLTINMSPDQPFRYLRFTAKNIGKVPEWHEAAGSDAWLFIDEISIR